MTRKPMTWKRFMWAVRWRVGFVILVCVTWTFLPHAPGAIHAFLRIPVALAWGWLLLGYTRFYQDMGEVEKLLRIQGFFDD